MAILAFGLNVSLDGYVDHKSFAPSLPLFQFFIEHVRSLSGILYGRGLYEVMRYWDEDQPDWKPQEYEFARVWRGQHKWVVSRSLTSVGPNATLMEGEVVTAVRGLKQRMTGVIDVGGPVLAHSLGQAGLIDEYRLYLHPVVLGRGTPFFAGPPPPLRLISSDLIDEDVLRLTYAPTQTRNT